MIPACLVGDKPYTIGRIDLAGGTYAYPADSPAASCADFALASGQVMTDSTAQICKLLSPATVTTVYPVVPLCIVASAPLRASADDYAAISIIFGAVLTASCVIWGVKQIFNLVKNRPEA